MAARKTINDPSRYAECSAPFETLDKANEALTAFFGDVMESRKKHRIGDAYVIVHITYTDAEGKSHSANAGAQMGFGLMALPMLSWGLAKERALYELSMSAMEEDGRNAANE